MTVRYEPASWADHRPWDHPMIHRLQDKVSVSIPFRITEADALALRALFDPVAALALAFRSWTPFWYLRGDDD